jgi:hypothetical protein
VLNFCRKSGSIKVDTVSKHLQGRDEVVDDVIWTTNSVGYYYRAGHSVRYCASFALKLGYYLSYKCNNFPSILSQP